MTDDDRYLDRVRHAVAGSLPVPADSLPVPGWLEARIRTDRLVRATSGRPDEASDAEVLAFLYGRTSRGPLSPTALALYRYLVVAYAAEAGYAAPSTDVPSTLPDDAAALLQHLRRALAVPFSSPTRSSTDRRP